MRFAFFYGHISFIWITALNFPSTNARRMIMTNVTVSKSASVGKSFDLERLKAQWLAKTTTGFEPHPDAKKYHGFTCPNCGRHEFGTSPLPDGTLIGNCHGASYAAESAGCTFSWDRNNAQDEKNAIYSMSREEWMRHCEERMTHTDRKYPTK